MMTMTAALSILVPAFLAVHGPELAEIVEQSECAARITVMERTETRTAEVAGVRVRAEVVTVLWGACPPAIEIFYASSACGDKIEAQDLVAGLTLPNEAQRTYLGLEPGAYLLCGALPATDALCASLLSLHDARGADALLAMLNRERQHDPRVRRQAFRQVAHELSARRTGAEAFAPLVPLAEKEADPTLTAAYVAAFGATRCRAAADFVVRTLLREDDLAVAEGAQEAFPRLATPETVRELSARYDRAGLAAKARILNAVAPCAMPEAQELLERALAAEETAVPALQALQSAGRRFPAAVLPRIHDPVQERRARALIETPKAPTPALEAGTAQERRG